MTAVTEPVTLSSAAAPLEERVATCAAVLERFADDVDREGRFPHESIAAIKDAGLLSVAVPRELGGEGLSLTEMSKISRLFGSKCASTAMIYVMHQTQLMSIIRHGKSAWMTSLLNEVVSDQLLLASATTEINIGGDVRSSGCHVAYDGDRISLSKNAPVISYGEYADAVLATARRSEDSAPSDQVLVVCRAQDVSLTRTGTWDTMGFRGTCSPGFQLEARADRDAVLEDYSQISSQTMLPVSHTLWGSVWLGIADAALMKARRSVQKAARKTAGSVPPAALRLAELTVVWQRLVDTVSAASRDFDLHQDDPETLTTIKFALAMNNVKITASTLVVEIVGGALLVCGISGYREDHESRMSRLLRDSYGAALMVNNDRILANNAQLALVHRGL
ncbi:acyl-CoA dehydrogenase family protein [Actinomycetes bacterium M1A6_2h]